MYLKRLELYGFKTFAARTVLEFEHGVTGVVGPNGSGKSNLADAVRWALGEQNVRNVRCRHAEDLIFAGTAGQGARAGARTAMNMAEVLLTFDNSSGWLPVDFHEVRIGRRAYRSGENEYLLNGARVRLRDIADLLARAAISAGGHLVIGQGLVDTVLSLRPEERRTLIETLAGLRYYYSRRDDAENKLRAAETNLRQVDAMIAEATPHLAALREQAVAYAQYHQVERELRDLLLVHYAHAHRQAVERRDRQAAELLAAQAAVEGARGAVRGAETELTATRERARRLAHDTTTLRGEVRAAHDAREAAERELAVSRTRREAALARLAELRADLPSLEGRRAELARELARADDAARAIEAERASLDAAQEAIERAMEAAGAAVTAAERNLRALAEQRRGVEREEAASAAELAALEREETSAGEEERRLGADEQATANGLREAAAALSTAQARLDAAIAAVEAPRPPETRAPLPAAAAAESARLAGARRRDAERYAAELHARAGGLRAWLDAMSGAAGAATVAGVLVTAPELEQALAAALGPILSAREAARGLDAAGAAALLDAGARGVLAPGRTAIGAEEQVLLERALAVAGLGGDNLLGWGDGLARVEASGELAVALRSALSAVLVVRDLAAAWQAHAALRALDAPAAARVVLATPDGVALLPQGLLHRPAAEGAAALEQARELRQVEAEVRTAGEALHEAEAAARTAGEESQRLAAAAEAELRAQRAAEGERNAARDEVTAAERALAQAQREADWAAGRRRRASASATARLSRRRELESRREEVRAAIAVLARDEGPAAEGQQAARATVQETAQRRAEHGAALALVAERAGDALRRRRGAEEALLHLDEDLRARRAGLTRLEEEAERLGASEDMLAARVAEAAQRLRDLHERLRPLEGELAALEAQTVRLETLLTSLRPAEARATAAHEAAALALQRGEHEVESVTAALQADLALEPADLPPPGVPAAGLPGRVKALRARLAAFGPVNARAPEDLAAAAERQEFLQVQAADLREGIARLRALIAEANATVRERFAAVAGELDTQFRLYLQRLFDGGRGELTALYDEEGLPSGLEITAQPPGKKTRELALLSGGERALVGLALIFAMLAVRPVPFCVLDEAEAALDEANTLRVGEILRSLSAQTQFIVITHNRGTMSHADALYGVTMAESGVSQVASLRLADVEAVRQSRAG